jgi:hypothetical protein
VAEAMIEAWPESIGIDFRVQDGQLYGVGNGGGVYTIDTTNAQASLVN